MLPARLSNLKLLCPLLLLFSPCSYLLLLLPPPYFDSRRTPFLRTLACLYSFLRRRTTLDHPPAAICRPIRKCGEASDYPIDSWVHYCVDQTANLLPTTSSILAPWSLKRESPSSPFSSARSRQPHQYGALRNHRVAGPQWLDIEW